MIVKVHLTASRAAHLGFWAFLFIPALVLSAVAQDWSVDWSTIDSGGAVATETADEQWRLSGTIGQWDSSTAQALSSSEYQLTGGFWSIERDVIDQLFRDRFDALSPRSAQGSPGDVESP